MAHQRRPYEGLGKEIAAFLRLKKESTAKTYKGGLSHFLNFYRGKYGDDADIVHFLNCIIANNAKLVTERQPRLIEQELVEFIDYLKGLAYSNNSIRTYLSALQNFLKYYNISVSMSFVGNRPHAVVKPENAKHEWRIEDIRAFVDNASNYRDKAIILCLFQSGLSIGDLVELNYRDVRHDLEQNVIPVQLRLTRKKTGVPHRTFFGHDTVKYLRLYLATRRQKRDDSPLFTKWCSETRRITIQAIESKFKEIVEQVTFVSQTDVDNGYNPCRPHSLRAAFNSRLTGKIDRVLIEFWSGRAIGEEKRTYLRIPTDEMRELYMKAEKYLAIEQTSREALTERHRQGASAEIVDTLQVKVRELEVTVKGLTRRNVELESEKDTLTKKVDALATEIKLIDSILRDNEPQWFSNLRAPRRGARVEAVKLFPPPVSDEERELHKAFLVV